MNKRICLIIFLSVLLMNINWTSTVDVIKLDRYETTISRPFQMKVSTLPLHNPISISDNAGFESSGIFSGYGNKTHPYVFKDYFIQAGASLGISISNTDAYFIIKNVWANGSLDTGFSLKNVKNGQLISCTATNNTQNGIYLYNADNNFLTNNTISNSEYGLS